MERELYKDKCIGCGATITENRSQKCIACNQKKCCNCGDDFTHRLSTIFYCKKRECKAVQYKRKRLSTYL